jgi:hypothetical protein
MDYKSHRSLIESAIKAKINSLLNEQDATPAANTVKPNPLLDPRAARETRETVARTQQLAQDLLKVQDQVDFERDLDKLGQNPARLNVVYKTGLDQPITPEDFSRLSDEDKKSLSGSINIEGVKTALPSDYKSPLQIPSWTKAESAIIDNLKAEAAAAEEIDPDYKSEWTATQMATIAPFIMADQVKPRTKVRSDLEIGQSMGSIGGGKPREIKTQPEFDITDTSDAVLRRVAVVNPDAMDPAFFRQAYAALDASAADQKTKDRAKALAEKMEKRHLAARKMIVNELDQEFRPTDAKKAVAYDTEADNRKKGLEELFDKIYGDVTSTARGYRDFSLSSSGRGALTTDPYDLVKEFILNKNIKSDPNIGVSGLDKDKPSINLSDWTSRKDTGIDELNKFIEQGEHSNFTWEDITDKSGKSKIVAVPRKEMTATQVSRQLEQLMSGYDPLTDEPVRGFIELPDGTKKRLSQFGFPINKTVSELEIDNKEFLSALGTREDLKDRLRFAPDVNERTRELVTAQILDRLGQTTTTETEKQARLEAEASETAKKRIRGGVSIAKQFGLPIAVGLGADLATDIASSWLPQEWQKRIKDQGIDKAIGYGASGYAVEALDRSRDLSKDIKSLAVRGFIPSAVGGYLLDKYAKYSGTEDSFAAPLVGLAATAGSPYIAKGVKGAASWLPNAIKATRFVQGAGAFASRIPGVQVPGVVAAATGFGAELATRAGMAALGETTVDKSVRELMLSPEFKGFENSADETWTNTPRQYGNRTLTPRQKLTTSVDLFREKLKEGSIDFKPFKERDPTRYGDLPDVLESQQDKAKAYKIFIESELQKMREERDSTKPRPRSSGGGAGGPSAAQ